ncbi:MAG TPA: helix-turn-helix transcriptional regulator [Actinomycetota bacterium]|nr:helix-turn-helix transcriptional regulator [Actinomycetota bacterium]
MATAGTDDHGSLAVTVGKVIAEERRKQGLSQEALAHRSGLHRNHIGLVERGQKGLSVKALFAICSTIGLRPSEILRLVEESQTKL